MRRVSYTPYLFFVLFLFSTMSLPSSLTEKLRFSAVGSIGGIWERMHHFSRSLPHLFTPLSTHETHVENEWLMTENQLLKNQMESVQQWIKQEQLLQDQWKRYQSLQEKDASLEFFRRRALDIEGQMRLALQALPAKVIFREPSSWSSSLWINVGEKNNRVLGKQVVAPNSPVVVGKSIVGVVEKVGEERSRVRLISDPRLTPSVRAARGEEQNKHLLQYLDLFMQNLSVRQELFANSEEAEQLLTSLLRIKQKLSQSLGDGYLAKGELCGSGQPLWRSRGTCLKGTGFNYDYADREGPARDLRMAPPLLQEGDLLVTTGLDGVFPPGFHVGIVSKVSTLREGAVSYDLEALPTAGELDALIHLTVLPPWSQDLP